MANAFYQKFKQSLITEADTNKSLNQTGTNGTFVSLIDTGTYTFSQAHQFYTSLAGEAGTAQEITTPTVVNGLFDGDNVTFTSVVAGPSIEALVYWRKNSGASSTYRLVVFQDTSVTGLPVTPNGGDIQVQFNASGIFQLSDRREKENIREVGDVLGRFPIYEYNYNGNPQRHVGVMAQDVERAMPCAVIEFDLGRRRRKAVNYDQVIDRLVA